MKKWFALLSALPLVTFAATPEKIVTLGGDVTEIVYALGAQSSLVARDSTSQWPQAANDLPDVGYLRQLNAEGILSMRPTLVLASTQAQPSLALKQVEQSHVKVVTVPGSNDLSVIDEKVRVIAQATHQQAQGEILRGKLRQELAALPTTPLNKRVLFILNHGGMTAMAAGQQTGADAAIRAAGLQNAMQGFTRYQPLSQEGVIASQPDLVVISQDGVKALGGEENLWKLPGLAQTPAGRHKEVLAIDDMALAGHSTVAHQSRAAALMTRRITLSLCMLAVALLVMTLLATGFGALRLPVSLLWNNSDDALRQIWLTIRLPRVLLALVIGGSLALAGCVMQGLFRNPLADPGLLGISSGAALAVALWVVIPLSLPALVMLYAPMLAAFLGALAATVLIFLLSQQRESSLSRLLLVGIAINALCGAAVGVLSWISNDAQLRQLSLWGMGSLGQAQWSTLLAVTSLMVPTVWIIWRLATALNLLQLGEEEAHYLGVDVKVVQRVLLLCSALLVAAAVAVSGVIGFVGLVVPHLMRMWLGADHRAVIPGSVLAGAFLLLIADTVARTLVAPAEMPVGLLTSILGAPWFLWLIFRRGGQHG